MSYLDKDSEEKFVRFVERMPTVSYTSATRRHDGRGGRVANIKVTFRNWTA